MTKTVDYSDRASAVLFGDGSAAAIVSTKIPSRTAFVDCSFDSRPSAWEKVGVTHLWRFYQDGNAVQGFAIRATTEGVKQLQDRYAAEAKRFLFVGHQANLGMLKTVCDRTKIALENCWYNVDQFGNVGCSGAPSTLSAHWDDLRPGDRLAMSIVGAGLAWAHLMLKVEEDK